MKNSNQTTQPQNLTPAQQTLPAPVQIAMAQYEDLRLFELTADATGQMRPTISSLKVAQKFGKNHKDVLRAIQRLKISEDFNRRNFAPVEYCDAKGENRKAYNLTKDGFMFVAMGFTGHAADLWRMRFIECFNKMERELVETARQALLQNMAAAQKPLLAQTRREAAKQTASAVLSLPPTQKACLKKVLDYKAKNLTTYEIHKILDISKDTVRRITKTARQMGILEG